MRRAWPPPYAPKGGKGTYLFNLSADPTESAPLNELRPELLAAHAARLHEWREGIARSQLHETLCRRDASSHATPT